MKKSHIIFPLVFIGLLLGISMIRPASALEPATVNITPSTLTVDKDTQFNVTVTITNATDVFGWQIVVLFNASIVQCVNAYVPADNIFGSSYIAPSPQINNVAGSVVYGANAAPGTPNFNGSGTLCIIVFNATSLGDTQLSFDADTTHTWYSYIYNDNIEELPAIFEPATVTVIPEFSAALLIVAFASLTFIVAVFKKKFNATSKS